MTKLTPKKYVKRLVGRRFFTKNTLMSYNVTYI